MDYSCGKFGDFSRFGSAVWINRQTDADERFSLVALVGVSNKHLDQTGF